MEEIVERGKSPLVKARRSVVIAAIPALLLASCHGKDAGKSLAPSIAGTPAPANDAARILSALKARAGSPLAAGLATGFDFATTGGLKPRFAAADVAAEPRAARVTLPKTASDALHVEDAATGVAVDVSLKGATRAAAQAVDGYMVYRGAFANGANVLHRALPGGAEDFVALDARPEHTKVAYEIALSERAAGLRLVGGTLEVVDASGTPRLRVTPPYVVGADGARTDATLAVAGCAIDTNPAAPWGRGATAPGAKSCEVSVTWPATGVAYPAILDPRWTTTGSMGTARQEHSALMLANGKVLVAGGRSSSTGTAGLATAELYDRTTGTWTPTGSMTGGRRLHSMTQLNTGSNATTSGKVLVAGGIDGTTSLTTAQLYDPTLGTWTAAANLSAARHLHTETLLPDGRVLVAGGMNGTATLQTAAVYNPATGTGSWTATTGPIPPPGWRFGTATLIQTTNAQLNNRVLLVGGNNGTVTIASVFLFDPVQNAFSTLASLSNPREQHTAVALPATNGKILVTGGKNGAAALPTALIFDPSVSNGTWSAAGTMTSARFGHSATVLPTSIVANGSVLVAGGNSGSGALTSAELFSGTSTWTATTAMPSPPSQGHTATLLGNNMVLVAGGLNGSTVLNNARLYDAAFGLACTSGSQCPSGNCVNGVCCDTACNGGCGACNLAGHVGTCTALSSGTVCRAAAAGGCDVAETCNGSSLSCPADGFAPTSTVCRAAAAGGCDVAENCPGNAAACPADAKKPSGAACPDDGNACTTDLCNGTSVTCQHAAGNAGTICRAAMGECDQAEACTGSSSTCPSDVKKPSGTACTDDGVICTTDTCNGTATTCQHPAGNAGTQCRAATADCDLPATCTGSSATCPANPFKPASTVCRGPGGECDLAENCTGSSATCPMDAKKPSGTACTDDGIVCTTDLCNGTLAACQHAAGNAGTVCRASAGACDVAETCSGSSTSCPADAFASNGTACNDGDGCTLTDACQGGACVGSNPKTCPAQGECTSGGACISPGGTCSNTPVADGTICTGGLCASGICKQAGNPPTPVDRTVPMDLGQSTAFLYEGANPQQIGVPTGTIKRDRASVYRGKVQDHSGQGIKGVVVRVVGRPEYGFTQTGDDGIFSLAANGGEDLRLRCERHGYLPVERVVFARPLDYAPFPDVVMTAVDPARTVVDLAAATTVQVAQATPTSDDSGSRQSVSLFFPGTTATLVHGDGSTQPLDTLTFHSTEFTVGPDGPKAMPADLPPSSGYTYAVDLSVEESGGEQFSGITFNQPVVNYVDNFLHFSVGSIVPVGRYDDKCGCWVPTDNGKVIRILSEFGGLADVDADGDGAADTPQELAALGITDDERATLATLYLPGASVWRAPLTHFSPIDMNFPRNAPNPSNSSSSSNDDEPEDDDCEEDGSIVNCQKLVLGERIPLTGVPYALTYSSARTPGYVGNVLDVRLTGATLIPGIQRVELDVSVAGQKYHQTFPPIADQKTTFTWDGQDGFGRLLAGRQPATTRISYIYQAASLVPADQLRSFAAPPAPGLIADGDAGRATVSVSRTIVNNLNIADARRTEGLGGWTLDVHHTYDPRTLQLTLGDGSLRSAPPVGLTPIEPTKALFFNYTDFLPTPDGSVYFAGPTFGFPVQGGDIIRLRPDGTNETVAAGALASVTPSGSALWSSRAGILFAPYNQLHRQLSINRLNSDGTISHVAGDPNCGLDGAVSGDEGPATQACFGGGIYDMAEVPNGDLYVLGAGNDNGLGLIYLRRVDCNGIIHRVRSGLSGVLIESTPDSTVFVHSQSGQNSTINKLMQDGTLSPPIAGSTSNPAVCVDGDGGIRDLCRPLDFRVGPDGQLYVLQFVQLDPSPTSIRRGTLHVLRPDGKLVDLFPGLGVDIRAFKIAPNGDFIVAAAYPAVNPPPNQFWDVYRFYWLRSSFPKLAQSGYSVPSGDGGEVYVFDTSGRHLRTLDGLTSATKYAFTYDGSGFVSAIADRNGLTTSFQRDGSGNPTAIVSPTGQQTTLGTDGNGYLASVLSPGGAQYQFQYVNGLLTHEVDPRNGAHQFTYDSKGRLIKDENPAGGGWTLDRQGERGNRSVTMVSGEGRSQSQSTTDTMGQSSTDASAFVGLRSRVVTATTGLQTIVAEDSVGNRKVTYPDGTVVTTAVAPDQRLGMAASYVAKQTITMPSGLTYSMASARTSTTAPDGVTLTSQAETSTVNGRNSTAVYDGASRTTTTTSPTGRQKIVTADDHGRPTVRRAGTLAPFTYTYDARGRIGSVTQGSGPTLRSMSFTYDTLDRQTAISDPLSSATQYQYDADNRATTSSVAPDGQITWEFDTAGDAISLTPAARPAHQFSYSQAGDVTSYTPPAVAGGPSTTTYDYDLDRQPTVIHRPDGTTIDIAYDSGGRVSAVTYPKGPDIGDGTVTVTRTFNPTTGTLQALTTSDGQSVSFGYDGSLLTSTTSTGTVTGSVSRTFNNDFRVASESVDNADSVAYGYDDDGLLTSAGSLNRTLDPTTGLLTDTALGGVSDHRTYDSFGQVATYDAKFGGTSLYSVVYTRDLIGRIETKSETIQDTTTLWTYSYDPNGRLWQVMKDGTLVATYLYDLNGNRLSKTTPSGTESATYDDQDRLVTYGKWAYTYTAGGDLRTKTDSTTSAVTRYSYDGAGNLRKVELSDGRVIEYVIDPIGRRVGKMVNGAITRRWLYEGMTPVAEIDGTGNVVSRFAAGGVIKGTTSYRIVADHLGSPRLLVDTSTGAIVQRMEHDEWGVVTADSASGFTPFGFAVGLYDEDTQLVRFGERDYDPNAGRWTSKDPIGFAGEQPNLFAYVEDDPINLIDPDGKAIQTTFNQLPDDYAHPGLIRQDDLARTFGGAVPNSLATVPCTKVGECNYKFDATVRFFTLTFYRPGIDPTRIHSRESPGLTLAAHEALHVGDYRSWYGNLRVNAALITEGFRSRARCEAARGALGAELAAYVARADAWSTSIRDRLHWTD